MKLALKIFLIILGVILIAAGIFAFFGWRAYAHLNNARDAATEAATSANSLNIDAVAESAATATSELRAADRSLRLLAPLQIIPTIGPRLSEGRRVINTAADALDKLTQALQPIADAFTVAKDAQETTTGLAGVVPDGRTIFRDLTQEQKRNMLAAVATTAPKLEAAVPAIDAATAALAAVKLEDLGAPLNISFASLRNQLSKVHDQLVQARQSIVTIAPITKLLPNLVGYPTPKHYVIFLANNTELRPAGGFLGVVGTATVADAELTNLSLRDVYAYDATVFDQPRPPVPVPMTRFLGVRQWFLRDANWSPDFIESAKTMEQFFKEEAIGLPDGNVPKIDGIIMFDPEIAADILKITGPITVDNVTFNSDNLVDQLEFQVEVEIYNREDYDPNNRKQAVADLAVEMIKRLESMSFDQLQQVAESVNNNLAESHLVMRFADPELQALALSKDWAGKMKPAYLDYLSVIDANLGALKTDAVMSRTIDYTVRPDGNGGLDAYAKLTYTNNGTFDYKTTRYQTYTRIYVPAGSELVSIDGALDPTVDTYDELGRRAFGAFLKVEPGQTKSMTFHYKLPAKVVSTVANGLYRLDVEKQIGSNETKLNLNLDLGRPGLKKQFSTNLRLDQTLLLTVPK